MADTPVKLTVEIGRSGLNSSGGQIINEYDSDLRGLRGIKIFEEMRRNDPTIAVGLRAINWMLGQVQWHVEPGGETPQDEEAAAFVESCFPAGTSITLTDFSNWNGGPIAGIVDIEKVQAGDTVLTHLGKGRKVTRTNNRLYTGELFSFHCGYLGDDIIATSEHPFFVRDRGLRRRRVYERNESYQPNSQRRGRAYQWRTAGDIAIGDYLVEPVDMTVRDVSVIDMTQYLSPYMEKRGWYKGLQRDVPLTPDLMRFIGYWLAEGTVTASGVQLTFNSDETMLHQDVLNITNQSFGVQGYTVTQDNFTRVYVPSNPVQKFLQQFQTNGRKSLPSWVQSLPPAKIVQLLLGLVHGDGHFGKAAIKLTIGKNNRLFYEQIRRQFLRVGVITTSHWVHMGRPDRKIKPFGTLSLQGEHARKFAILAGIEYGVDNQYRAKSKAFLANGYAHYPIESVDIEAVTDKSVYNLEVAGDNSYIASGVAVHNCMGDMSITWSKFIRDALTCLPFGFAYMEIVGKQRTGPAADPPSQYDDGKIGLRKIVLIGHESLARWEIDESGGIHGFVQSGSYGGGKYLPETLIPIEKAILFRLEDELNNPQGISLLRPCHNSWYKKKNLEEIEAIGIERDLTGVLIIHLPVNATATDQGKARDLLEQFKTDDMAGFTAPQFGPEDHEKWRFEIINSPGSKSIDTDKVISRYQLEIARTFLAQFLMLGQGSTGSYALGSSQRDMFEVALGAIIQNLEETINRFLVPILFRVNDFGTITALPQIQAGRLNHSDIASFATSLKTLADGGLLTPNVELEQYIRNEMQLPELPEDAEAVPDQETGQDEGAQEAREFDENGPDEDIAPLPAIEDDEAWRQLEDELNKQFKDGRQLGELLRFARGYDYDKRIERHVQEYSDAMGDLAERLRLDQIGYNKWSRESQVIVQRYTLEGYRLGIAKATGVVPSKVVLTTEQRGAATKAVQEQNRYLLEFRKDVKRMMTEGKQLTSTLTVRARMYAGAGASAATGAQLGEHPTKKLRWIRKKSDSCATCIGNEGKVKTAKEWLAGGVWPKHQTICHGNCGCELRAIE